MGFVVAKEITGREIGIVRREVFSGVTNLTVPHGHFHILGPLNKHLAGKRYVADADMKQAA